MKPSPLTRNTGRVTTRPGSCFGFTRVLSSSSAGFVPLRKAMFLPSGDHAGDAAPFLSLVSAVGSPPVIGSSWICGAWPKLFEKLNPPKS